MLLLEKQNAAYERPIVILWVKFRSGHVKRADVGVTVVEVSVQGQEVDIVHADVIAFRRTLEKADIDQGCTVEPKEKMLDLR